MTESAERTATTPAMKITIAVIGVIIVAAITVIVALMGDGRPDAAGQATPSPVATAAADATVAGPSPDARPTTGSEVPPPASPPASGSAPSTPRAALPPRSAAEPIVSAPLPPAGSREGDLVDGYPLRLAGPVNGSDVVSSSIATEGDVMQLSLVASSAASSDELVAHYRELWTSLGLTERSSETGKLTFTGGFESLSLTIASSGTGNRYSIFGVFRTS